MAVQASQDHFNSGKFLQKLPQIFAVTVPRCPQKKKKKNQDISNLGLMGRTELKKAITERRNLVFSIQTRTSGKQITGNPNCS